MQHLLQICLQLTKMEVLLSLCLAIHWFQRLYYEYLTDMYHLQSEVIHRNLKHYGSRLYIYILKLRGSTTDICDTPYFQIFHFSVENINFDKLLDKFVRQSKCISFRQLIKQCHDLQYQQVNKDANSSIYRSIKM